MVENNHAFRDNLDELMQVRGEIPAQFAKHVGITSAQLSKYSSGSLPSLYTVIELCRKLNVSADWLLGIYPDAPQSVYYEQDKTGKIKWVIKKPTSALPSDIELGIEIFRRIVNGATLQDCEADMQLNKKQKTKQDLRRAFQVAIKARDIFHLTYIGLDAQRAEAIKARFPFLHRVSVIDIPPIADATINVELIAFAAGRALSTTFEENSKTIGVGAGHTVQSVANYITPSRAAHQFYPLMREREVQEGLASAMNNCIFYHTRFPSSSVHELPFVEPDKRSIDDIYASNNKTLIKHDQIGFPVIICSLNGFEQENNLSQRELKYFGGSNVSNILHGQLRRFEELGVVDQVRLEYFGYFFDKNGQVIQDVTTNGEEARHNLGNFVREDVFTVNLEQFRNKVNHPTDNNEVYVVAGGLHKRTAVLACLRGKLTNNLFIDNTIADYILANS